MIGACGKLPPSEQRQDAQWSLGDYDYYCAGMHYKVLSRYAGGVTVINITLDSLKLQEYQFVFRDSIATYGGGGASGAVELTGGFYKGSSFNQPVSYSDSDSYYYAKLLKFDPLNDVDSFFKYINLYTKSLNNNK